MHQETIHTIRRGLLALTIAFPIAAATAVIAQDEPPAETAPTAADLPSAKEVTDRHIEAIGGKEAIQQHRYRTYTGHISVPAMNMKGAMRVHAAAPSFMHLSYEIPGMGTSRAGYDGEVGWSLDDMQGPNLMKGAQLAEIRRQADFYAELNFDKHFKSMEVTQQTSFDDAQCYEVRCVDQADKEILLYFDAESHLLRGGQSRPETPMGSAPATQLYRNYREFDGVKIATLQIVRMLGMEQHVEFDSITHERFDREIFELPAPVKALVEQQKADEDDEKDDENNAGDSEGESP